MPHFRRRPVPPPPAKRYQHYRDAVREDFRGTCAYCLFEEFWAGGAENFEIDHFRPVSLFPQLRLHYYNLYWACHVCNRFKSSEWPEPIKRRKGIGFVDLCRSTFDDHFRVKANGELRGVTPSGRYSIKILRLNRRHLIRIRSLLHALELS